MSDETPRVIMYCRSWCGDCRRARAWLQENGIPYTEIDVEEDADAHSRAADHNGGHLHTPTFEIGDGVCVDFRPDKIKELLGME
jgi:mycoredoxin